MPSVRSERYCLYISLFLTQFAISICSINSRESSCLDVEKEEKGLRKGRRKEDTGKVLRDNIQGITKPSYSSV